MDSVRTAKRLGRSVGHHLPPVAHGVPARGEEVKHAEEEGIEFHFLTTPIRYIGDEAAGQGHGCLRMELRPDASGRRRPVPIEGRSSASMDLVIVAVGQSPNLIAQTTPELRIGK